MLLRCCAACPPAGARRATAYRSVRSVSALVSAFCPPYDSARREHALVRGLGDLRRPLSLHAILPESTPHSKEAVASPQLRPPATDLMAVRDRGELRPGRRAAFVDHDGTARMKRAT